MTELEDKVVKATVEDIQLRTVLIGAIDAKHWRSAAVALEVMLENMDSLRLSVPLPTHEKVAEIKDKLAKRLGIEQT